MDLNRQKKNMQDVSMIPLINVIFMLLAFFMVAGSIAKFDIIPIEIPMAESSKALDEGAQVIVLGYHGQTLLNDELVPGDGLEAMLTTRLRANPNAIVTLKIDARLPARKLIDMMELIRRAGGKNLSLTTRS